MDKLDQVTERLFYGSSQETLLRILNVRMKNELISKQTIEIPNEIYSVTSNLLQRTLNDSKERAVDFKNENGKLIAQKVEIGPEFNWEQAMGEVKLPVRRYQTMFGKQSIISYHTHPQFTPETLEKVGVKSVNLGQIKLPIEKGALLTNAFASWPSPEDLENIMVLPRYWRSSLIGTLRGYVWIINPNTHIPFIARSKNRNVYQEQMIETVKSEALRISKLKRLIKYDYGQFDTEAGKALKRFCETNRLIAFRNSNPNSQILQRI